MTLVHGQKSIPQAARAGTGRPVSLQRAPSFSSEASLRAGRCRAEAESGRSGGQRGLIVKPLPPVRQAAAPPQPVLVEHSPSYLLRGRSRQEADEAKPIVNRSRDEEPFTGNAVQWAVRRLDAGLDTAEHDPPPAAKALINAARGPAGAATVKGVTAAARITVQFGTEALKAAAPVGKWVVQQSFKAAFGDFSQNAQRGRPRKASKRDEEGKEEA